MGEGDPLDVALVAFHAEFHRPFDLVRREIAASPDHIAVATVLESSSSGVAALVLPLPSPVLDLLDTCDGVSALFEPLDPARIHVRIDLDPPAASSR